MGFNFCAQRAPRNSVAGKFDTIESFVLLRAADRDNGQFVFLEVYYEKISRIYEIAGKPYPCFAAEHA